jgi:hypothetical protein
MNAEAEVSGELSVRFVVREDYEQWLLLWDGYNAFYGRSGTTALSPEITRMTWTRFFAGAACRIIAGVLANPPNKPHRDAALRQGRGALRVCRVSQAALTSVRFARHTCPASSDERAAQDRSGLWISPAVTGA